VDAELRITGDLQVDVVRHGLDRLDRGGPLGADLADDLFKSVIDHTGKDLAATRRAPHHVVGAPVHDGVVGANLIHGAAI
jgi:hypothetical protein